MNWKRSEREARVANRFERPDRGSIMWMDVTPSPTPPGVPAAIAVQKAYDEGRRRG